LRLLLVRVLNVISLGIWVTTTVSAATATCGRARYNYPVFRLSLIVVSLLVTLMPPGLCPCWLMEDVRALHPHPGGFPDSPHDHDYLFEIFQAQPVAAAELTPNPVGALIEQLLGGSVWHTRRSSVLWAPAWHSSPPTPPPRFS
jgi:hypothetical protein